MKDFSVQIEEQARRSPASSPDWPTKIVLDLAEYLGGPTERLVIASAAALRALDEHHRDEPPVRDLDELPDTFGSLQTLFLPPPGNWIAERIPDSRVLDRDRGHFDRELRKILKLWWHVIPLEQHAVKPTPRRLELEAATDERLRRRLDRNSDLRIALAGPLANSSYDYRSEPWRRHPEKGTPFRCAGLKPDSLEDAQQALDRILEACRQHQVDILCFPELTLDNDLLGHLKQSLLAGEAERQPALTVAGSFHLGKEGRCWNRCYVLNPWGETLFYQDKTLCFEVTPKNARGMSPEQHAEFGIDESGGFENIDPPDEIRLVDSVLGRLATPICLDYIGDALIGLFLDTYSNLFFVPAMTPRMKLFVKRAVELGTKCRASSFVVNNARICPDRDSRPRKCFLAYVPAEGGIVPTKGDVWDDTSPYLTATSLPVPDLIVCSIRKLVQ